jgi:hypothetical protein
MRAESQQSPERGLTPNELARVWRVSPDWIRALIRSGEIGAVNTARHRCGRPRFVILPHHLAEWEQRRRTPTPEVPKPKRKKKPTGFVDYYPD